MLSKRIENLINSLDKCNVLADIGCDHGYIAVEAIKRGIANKVIAIDLNPKPLKKAVHLAIKENVEDRIEFVTGNGFEPISERVDEAVIAGMGGKLICSILEDALGKIDDTVLILQPMKDIESLRRWLFENSFDIVKEMIIKDRQKFYVVIKSKKSKDVFYSDIDIYVGRHFLDKNSISYKYLENQKEKLLRIIESKKAFGKDFAFEKWKLDLIEEVLKAW